MQRSLVRNLYFEASTTIASLMQETRIGDHFVILSPGHNAVVDEIITIYDSRKGIYQGKINNFISNTIYLDQSINTDFCSSSHVHKGIANLSMPINGEEFKKFNISSLYSHDKPLKLKKIKGYAKCDNISNLEDSKFFNIPALQKGITIETQGHINEIICNIKNNIDLQTHFYVNQMTFGDPNFKVVTFEYQYEILLNNSNLVITRDESWNNQSLKELVFFAEVEQEKLKPLEEALIFTVRIQR